MEVGICILCSPNVPREQEQKREQRRVQAIQTRQATLTFPMSFPKGYGSQKKVRAWMDDFQKLPYISKWASRFGDLATEEALETKKSIG
ncbi:unnamed protein product [Linum trigynum]|uniref:PORR domain-containing protein n=1 Tax=Linum trigynum TaxID=586398 RepID=A0AAV2GIG4_9ROSI